MKTDGRDGIFLRFIFRDHFIILNVKSFRNKQIHSELNMLLSTFKVNMTLFTLLRHVPGLSVNNSSVHVIPKGKKKRLTF